MSENGRPTKFTPETTQRILRAVRNGNTREDAAALAGITGKTLREWMANGRKNPTGPFGAFCAAIKRADAKATAVMVGRVRIAARTTWQAAAWYLERRHPDNWGSQTREIAALKNDLAELRLLLHAKHSKPSA